MGWFHDVVHSVQHVIDQGVKPVGNLFNSHTALTRALVNPADPVAVGQVFDNTAIKGQAPKTQAKDVQATTSHFASTVGTYHQDLWNNITDGVHWLGHAIRRVYFSVWDQVKRTWVSVGGKKVGDKLGDNIKSTIDKWGGERRVVGWVIFGVCVIIYILSLIFSWGLSAPAVVLLASLASYGAQQGMTPDAPKQQSPLSLFTRGDNIDNTKITTIDTRSGGSGNDSSPSFLQAIADSLAGLHPAVVVGAAAVGALGVFYLLKK